jgi:hypothetical protein
MFCAAMLVCVAASLGGCASDLIEVKPGSRQVTLAEQDQVANCQAKGEITVSVLAKVGFISRSVEDVDANLLQLARNGAVDAGGDTVVKGARPQLGTRTFAIYKCRP